MGRGWVLNRFKPRLASYSVRGPVLRRRVSNMAQVLHRAWLHWTSGAPNTGARHPTHTGGIWRRCEGLCVANGCRRAGL
jgi:hypothetical protein